jgi:hypothetical protein
MTSHFNHDKDLNIFDPRHCLGDIFHDSENTRQKLFLVLAQVRHRVFDTLSHISTIIRQVVAR